MRKLRYVIVIFFNTHIYFHYRNGGFPLDNCQCLATSLLKLINKCYWKSAQKDDGCMLPDEIDLAEHCLDTLTVLYTFINI